MITLITTFLAGMDRVQKISTSLIVSRSLIVFYFYL
jgi:hypothetical protein